MSTTSERGYVGQFLDALCRLALWYLVAGMVASWLLRYLAWYRVCPPLLAWVCRWAFEPIFVFVFGIW